MKHDRKIAPATGPSLEIRFRAAEIATLCSGTDPAEYCAEAMVLIDASLFFATAGSCAEPDARTDPATGEQELVLPITAPDCDAAERIIRRAVRGTSYDRISAIIRAETAPIAA